MGSRNLRIIVASIALTLLLAGALALGARAETRPSDALAERAREILTKHCAACREIGLSNAPGSPAPLDLTAIAHHPSLVRPGNPDGSPAYTEMIRRFGAKSAGNGNAPPPTVDDLATLRAWIESLPLKTTCPEGAVSIARGSVEPMVRRQALMLRRPTSALRVISLAHLNTGCVTPDQLARWRGAIGMFLAALAGRATPVPTYPLDRNGHLLAVDIEALRWDNEHWRVLTGAGLRAARANEPLIVRADWLIVHVLRGELGARLANPMEPATPPADFHEPSLSPSDRDTARAMLDGAVGAETADQAAEVLLRLAWRYLAPADMKRVAAELGVAPDEFEAHIATSAGSVKDLLLRLTYGAVSRAEIEDNWLVLARLAGVAPPARTTLPVRFDAVRPPITSATPVELTLYADRVRYAPGDALQLTVRANVDCRLTVISIDTAGHGTVIFPNDFATDNLVSAQLNLHLPASDARYRFRVKEKGHERITALCTRAEGSVDGIQHDFERQRFQELGPYTAFLETALKRRSGNDRQDRRAARPIPLDQIWRTGIVLAIE